MKMWMLRVFFSPQMNLKILGQFKKSHTPTKPLIIEACTIPTDVLIIPTIPDSLNLPSKELKIKNCASPFKVYTSKKNPISLDLESRYNNPPLIDSIGSDLLLPIALSP